MVHMSKPSRRVSWNTRANVFTDTEAKEALSTAVSRLRRADKLRFLGAKLTQEVVFGALCLWADAQPVEALERLLGPHVAQLEAIISARKAQGDPPDTAEGHVEGITMKTTNRPKPKKPKAGGSGLKAHFGGEAV